MAEQETRETGEVGPRPRRLVCEVCGAEFGCTLDGPCWCSDEPYRLPLPRAGDAARTDCLCPACLRARAALLNDRVACDP